MAFLGVLKELRAAAGADPVAHALPYWGADLAAVVKDRIVATDWYPYAAFAQLLAGAERELGDGTGALSRELGHAAARNDLRGAFAVLKLLASAQHLIGACERVWPRYYRNAGRMVSVSTRPENTVVRIHDFPGMAPEHCKMMEGWMISAMDVLGVTVLPGAEESMCASKGAPYHEFTCKWKK